MKLNKFATYIIYACLLTLLSVSPISKVMVSSSYTYTVNSDNEDDDHRTQNNNY